MRKFSLYLCLLLLVALLVPGLELSAQQAKQKAADPQYDEALYQAMQWRGIGPYRGGRGPAGRRARHPLSERE